MKVPKLDTLKSLKVLKVDNWIKFSIQKKFKLVTLANARIHFRSLNTNFWIKWTYSTLKLIYQPVQADYGKHFPFIFSACKFFWSIIQMKFTKVSHCIIFFLFSSQSSPWKFLFPRNIIEEEKNSIKRFFINFRTFFLLSKNSSALTLLAARTSESSNNSLAFLSFHKTHVCLSIAIKHIKTSGSSHCLRVEKSMECQWGKRGW